MSVSKENLLNAARDAVAELSELDTLRAQLSNTRAALQEAYAALAVYRDVTVPALRAEVVALRIGMDAASRNVQAHRDAARYACDMLAPHAATDVTIRRVIQLLQVTQ